MISENSRLLYVKSTKFSWLDIGTLEGMYKFCHNKKISCYVNPEDIKKFNEQNKEFELSYNNGYTHITKKLD